MQDSVFWYGWDKPEWVGHDSDAKKKDISSETWYILTDFIILLFRGLTVVY